MEKKESNINDILEKAAKYEKLSLRELEYLFSISNPELMNRLFSAADKMRKELAGDVVTYVKNRNINFTNICKNSCEFCAYRRNKDDVDSYFMGMEEILEKLSEDGITEVCIQGGLNPDLNLEFYGNLLATIKLRHPDIHIHGFSPMEVKFMSEISGLAIEDVLRFLKYSGLGSMPGTAAEILVDEIREKICPDKLKKDEWVRIVKTAHNLGIPTTATIMFGHIETAFHKARHLAVLMDIQEETGCITEFIPLPFIPFNTKLAARYSLGMVPEEEIYKMYSISRIYFGKMIPNIQASWVKIGFDAAKKSLSLGVNDLGGTLGEEKISKSAGSKFGQCVKEEVLRKIILEASRVPLQRNTLYQSVEKEKENELRLLPLSPLFS
ncbi:MAG: 7,8-didemethyl-8-hydroxy-5-deazariboflavin synthase subunit CofH [Candidatus Schekmanbacteria bacterium RIFCSPHIGHO2_02_FULL_38_11]|uniref:7,8-didemethyl-8-hydroxy-5-deazariboflavin synthase subunit CofH n=1 Tax=Candidatus Schekmanbacteria bacterium RIFCSPLOWO2_12_FULL_38_15 TaxID=1817883 RepID=A0A1F7SFY1_9BACT|nr:MAG: 7,8-didemethyl-8-hydroxy-5-deazariboflavin synthase subunit CofH [Candidatus Schekmanbacteria bacterium GWA2_38_9]OGL48642.1 MAG: 7,8-didemethyl-8-hydroxy-5-deazariboflavin synthase subunit CofH [Candidatus Schekmanbacteria bacterium RIFCSPLOWO2_02_FULL_38_14]OGL50169.1 MAG: 7,8-didemethyl-8-hydroxy-5-deazariboflavin synthase subunit CofH [Candidatus Schekmanbacteria bacterium RIFCSPHIGHO2_02_FULL_38_11]OGL52692.1 MAG: 7,8-didemethyl-8-hydroxy-5-deazariboflavin synthase subunit CofH [Can